MNNGISIGTNDGDSVYAIADGVVTAAECEKTDEKRNGCFVEVKLSNGYSVLYGYNTSIAVSVGDSVVKGQQIANTGLTKNKYASGSLLKLEMKNERGEQVNPMDYLSIE
jgi:murein DD-endopeptidase MepM/ murein hydrolase activator NlpD